MEDPKKNGEKGAGKCLPSEKLQVLARQVCGPLLRTLVGYHRRSRGLPWPAFPRPQEKCSWELGPLRSNRARRHENHGNKTRSVFWRYDIVDERNLIDAAKKIESARGKSRVSESEQPEAQQSETIQ